MLRACLNKGQLRSPFLASYIVLLYLYPLTDFKHDWAAPQPLFSILHSLEVPLLPVLSMIGQLRSPFVASYKVLLYLYSLTDFSLRNFDMADNYLENQYEAYLARKAAKERQKRLLFKKQLKAYKERLARENATAADDVVTEPQHRP